jgi:hypothetical protein
MFLRKRKTLTTTTTIRRTKATTTPTATRTGIWSLSDPMKTGSTSVWVVAYRAELKSPQPRVVLARTCMPYSVPSARPVISIVSFLVMTTLLVLLFWPRT